MFYDLRQINHQMICQIKKWIYKTNNLINHLKCNQMKM